MCAFKRCDLDSRENYDLSTGSRCSFLNRLNALEALMIGDRQDINLGRPYLPNDISGVVPARMGV